MHRNHDNTCNDIFNSQSKIIMKEIHFIVVFLRICVRFEVHDNKLIKVETKMSRQTLRSNSETKRPLHLVITC